MKNQFSRELPPIKIQYQGKDKQLLFLPFSGECVKTVRKAVENGYEHLTKFLPWVHQHNSIEEQAKIFMRFASTFYGGNEYSFAVYEAATQEFLLCCSLYNEGRNPRALATGYWTTPKHQNKGYATLACQIMVITAFECFQADRVGINCNEENLASKRVIEKCGFHYEGKIRNYMMEPTEEMLKNGFCKNRTHLGFSLLPEDLKSLSWYKDILKATVFTSCLGDLLKII